MVGRRTAWAQQPRTDASAVRPHAAARGNRPLVRGLWRQQTAVYGSARIARRPQQKRPRSKRPRALGKDGARDRSRERGAASPRGAMKGQLGWPKTDDPQLGKPTQGQEVTRGYAQLPAGACTERHGAAPVTAPGSKRLRGLRVEDTGAGVTGSPALTLIRFSSVVHR